MVFIVRKNNEGKVYWGKTRYIDYDIKPRRQFLVVKDDGKNVKVAKLTSLDEKKKQDKRFLQIKKYPELKKDTGVYKSLYGKNRVSGEKLSLNDKYKVFDKKESFSIDDEDLNRVNSHVIKRGIRSNKKGRQ